MNEYFSDPHRHALFMQPKRVHVAGPGRQQGISLIVCLVMLFATLMLGISAAGIVLQGEKAARNDRDRQIATEAAEAALADAEYDIERSPNPSRSRSHIFANDRADGFTDGCGSGIANEYLGLCSHAPEGAPPVWMNVDFFDGSAQAKSVPYGHFTGQTFQTGAGTLPSKPPRYIIELLPYIRAGEDVTGESRTYLYRITAIGFGTRDTTQVVLQAVYRKERN